MNASQNKKMLLIAMLLLLSTQSVQANWSDKLKEHVSEHFKKSYEETNYELKQIEQVPQKSVKGLRDISEATVTDAIDSNSVMKNTDAGLEQASSDILRVRKENKFLNFIFGKDQKLRLSEAEKFELYKRQREHLTDEVLALSDLSNDVYDEDGFELQDWDVVLDETDKNFLNYEKSILAYDKEKPPKTLFVPDWAIEADANDFQAKLYRNKYTNTYAIAYRGTQEGADWITNTSHIFKIPEQYKRARHFYNFISQQDMVGDMKKVQLTGHSLGGGMAQYVGGFEGNETVIFNAANLQEPTLNDSLQNSDYCKTMQDCAHIKSFRYGGDQVSLMGNGNLGEQYQIGSNEDGLIIGDILIGDHDVVNFRIFAQEIDQKIAEFERGRNAQQFVKKEP